MSIVIADTQAVVWYLYDLPKLSRNADAAITASLKSGTLYISSITLVELNYLSTKKSFPYTGALPRILALAKDPSEPIRVLPLTIEVAEAMDFVLRNEVPDMPDRIIAATAIAARFPLVSADSDIQTSASLKSLVAVIW